MGTGGDDLFGIRKDGHELPVEIGLNPIETEEGLMQITAEEVVESALELLQTRQDKVNG